MEDIEESELEIVDGGKGQWCVFAVGVAVGAALVNPLTLFFTVEAITAPACIADMSSN